jgi:hypothetical protein
VPALSAVPALFIGALSSFIPTVSEGSFFTLTVFFFVLFSFLIFLSLALVSSSFIRSLSLVALIDFFDTLMVFISKPSSFFSFS